MGAVSRWRGHTDQCVHRCALIGLARVQLTPDTTLLAELADYLVLTPSQDWPTEDETIANAAAAALGGRPPH